MKKTQIVGILNCTDDSFFKESCEIDPEKAIARGLQLLKEGADIIDVGGESTRPGSKSTPEEVEISRIVPVIKGLRAHISNPISIDTFKPKVAEEALKAGANFLNDITGFSNPRMRALAKESKVPLCVMHMLGKPHHEPSPNYPRGVIEEILDFFKLRTQLLIDEGIDPSQIILDPGVGGRAFGKTPEQDLQIVKHLKQFRMLGFPLYLGISRKSFMQKILNKPASETLSTTIALNTMSLQEGVEYIRVHDVEAHRDIRTILDYLRTIE